MIKREVVFVDLLMQRLKKSEKNLFEEEPVSVASVSSSMKEPEIDISINQVSIMIY